MKNNIIVFILGLIAFYLLVAFVTLKPNPINWTQELRLMFALISPLVAAIFVCIYNIIK